MSQRLVVHIDTLALNGFERGSQAAIAEAVRRELAGALAGPAAGGALAAAGSVERLRVHAPLARDAPPPRVGQAVARAVAAGILPPRGPS
jgi:hypothetical protein